MAQRKSIESRWDTSQVAELIEEVIGASQHAATTGSVVAATIGIVGAKDLRLHRIGAAMASSLGLAPKHATKQVDRFLSKSSMDMPTAQRSFASYVLADQEEIVVAMDWTEFDGDDQSTLCIYVLSTHGRALPLLWRSVVKSELKGQRTRYELELVRTLAAWVPPHVHIVLTADRGFGYQEMFKALDELGIDFVIRVRGDIELRTADGTTKKTAEWVTKSGRARKLDDVRITAEQTPLASFVAVHAKRMKEAWLLGCVDKFMRQ